MVFKWVGMMSFSMQFRSTQTDHLNDPDQTSRFPRPKVDTACFSIPLHHLFFQKFCCLSKVLDTLHGIVPSFPDYQC